MATICKFTCTKKDTANNQVIFQTLYDPNLPEDQRFCNATPWGELKATIDNPKVMEQYEEGKAYFIIIKSEEEYKNAST